MKENGLIYHLDVNKHKNKILIDWLIDWKNISFTVFRPSHDRFPHCMTEISLYKSLTKTLCFSLPYRSAWDRSIHSTHWGVRQGLTHSQHPFQPQHFPPPPVVYLDIFGTFRIFNWIFSWIFDIVFLVASHRSEFLSFCFRFLDVFLDSWSYRITVY